MKDIISMSTLCIEKYTLEEDISFEKAFSLLAETGVKGVDLFEEYIQVHPHANLYQLRELEKMIKKNGMIVNSCWYYTDPLRGAYVTSREDIIEQLKEYIAITGFLGGRYIALPPGEPAPGMNGKQAQEALQSIYEEVVPVCEEYNVIIGMEVGRMHSPISSPIGALEVVKNIQSKYITVCPDWEAWRLDNPKIPDFYAECPDIKRDPPCPLSVLEEILPYSPFIHAKLFEFDEETGLDPNFPLNDMFEIINKSMIKHSFSIEYDGWTPDCFPEKDPLMISKQLYNMLETNLV